LYFLVSDLKGNPLPANILNVLNENNGTQKLLGILYDQVSGKLNIDILEQASASLCC
jgi:hypothetical protein